MAKPPEIDEKLWLECQRVIPRVVPSQVSQGVPFHCGVIDGDVKVLLVSGRHVKVTERKGKKNAKNNDDFMDFVEGGNGIEDPELCAKDEIVLDADHALDDLAPVCYHEAVERRDMLTGMSYDKAHARANAAEKVLRKRLLGGAR